MAIKSKAKSKLPAIGLLAVGGIFLTSAVMNIKISTIIRDVVSGDLSFVQGGKVAANTAVANAPTVTPKLPKIVVPPVTSKSGGLLGGKPKAPIVAPPPKTPTFHSNALLQRHSVLKQAVSG